MRADDAASGCTTAVVELVAPVREFAAIRAEPVLSELLLPAAGVAGVSLAGSAAGGVLPAILCVEEALAVALVSSGEVIAVWGAALVASATRAGESDDVGLGFDAPGAPVAEREAAA